MPRLLNLDVLVAPYKPIVEQAAPTGKDEATWPATSASLITGERDAVLIDAGLISEDGGRIVNWVRPTGKDLTTVYLTHGHGDHFFSLSMILGAFPNARAVTAAAVVPAAQGQVSPGYLHFWTSTFPGQIPEDPVVPDAVDGDVIDVEGNELRVVNVGQSDTAPSTIVHIPSLDAVISGDVAYNGIHPWLAQIDHESACSGSLASSRSRHSIPGSSSPGISARTRATTIRPRSSAAARPTSATSSSLFPPVALLRNWSTR
jgi:glyoxylase-like metal-dependent hydrolase (beta-lactamase superfamily II)